MRRPLLLATLACVIAVGGCGESRNDLNALEWSDGPDNSKVATPKYVNGNRNQGGADRLIVRCWPRQGGYDCLKADEDMAAMIAVADLPKSTPDWPKTGYQCNISSGYARFSESISGDSGQQIQRTTMQPRKEPPTPGQAVSDDPWPRAFVENYMAKNKIKADGIYFKCADVADVLFAPNASLGTLASTALNYESLRE